jgi:uncharacterized protein YjbI with pentapeptide repeats
MVDSSSHEGGASARRSLIRMKRAFAWTIACIILIALVRWATWWAHKSGLSSSVWHRWRGTIVTDGFLPIGLAAVALLALLILWKVPHWQVGRATDLSSKERFDCINEARKTLATILGGTVLLAGFYSTWQNIKIAQEGQITDRFTKAIDQLGAVDTKGEKKVEVRLGGIYALARIADQSKKDHTPIMDVLCAYLRENDPNTPSKKSDDPLGKVTVLGAQNRLVHTGPSQDTQAILTVLGTRNRGYETEDYYLDLRGTNLTGANLDATNFSGADLAAANLYVAEFERADLHEADFTAAYLVSAKFVRADLHGATFTSANLTGAYLDRANLSGAGLEGADLSDAYLDDADLRGAHLSGVKLRSTRFYRADLRGTDLQMMDFDNANLDGADLRGADLHNARNVTQQRIEATKGDSSTRLPEGLHMPEGWKHR